MRQHLPQTHPRRAVDLSPRALLAAGVSGVLAADLTLAEGGRWSLVTRAEDLSPSSVQVHKAGSKGVVAVVSIMGPIDQRATWQPCEGMTDGYDTIEARFRSAVDLVANAGHGKVVLLIDSPGGDAAGMIPAVRRMRSYAERMGVEVESVADERATSAAFALALVGSKVHVPPRGRTASIGTVIVRKQAEDSGQVEVFRSGERKMRPNAVEPLNAEDRKDLQTIVDDEAHAFASLVAEIRGKDAEHWLSLDGRALSGEAALKAGLIDSNKTAHEVIEMALKDEEQRELAGELGLSAGASFAEIKARVSEANAAVGKLAAVNTELAQAREKLARVEADRIAAQALETQQKAEREAKEKRAAFVAEVTKACSVDRVITPDTEAALLAHYDAHGEASARATFGVVKKAAPIVNTSSVGAVPDVSSAALTDWERARAKELGMTEAQYAEYKTDRNGKGT